MLIFILRKHLNLKRFGYIMNNPIESSERLHGSVERVTFHSEESGFCVLRTKVKGHRDLVTVVGNAASITAGEYIEGYGHWIQDREHGLQFKTHHLKIIPPSTLEGIEKYLGSGLVKGIGPHFAKKLVKAFGERVFDIIEQEPNRLLELEGIGQKRKSSVVTAWAEQKAIRKIMVFLQSYGIGTSRSVRIYKTYGDQAIELIRENPYRLALDIYGIGFKTADQLAKQLGIPENSLIRAEAGMRHVLHELCEQGHCAVPVNDLIKASQALLSIESSLIETAIESELKAENIAQDTLNTIRCIYPISLYKAEVNVASTLKKLNTNVLPWKITNIQAAIHWVEDKTHINLSASQQQAIEIVLTSKISIITGGPGVGKTTLVKSLITIFQAKHMEIALCAPTGRAAKRLSETSGLQAKTIHRLLEFDPKGRGFKYNHENTLPIHILIVDETSMLDIVLFNSLLKAIPNQAALILVGDIDQLPSVGSGAVLADLIKSNVIATIRLTEIFRQAANSNIIVNAHRVNAGQMPLVYSDSNSDFFTLFVETVDVIHDKVIELVTKRLPNHYGCNPIKDIQVLTPMNRGGLGSQGLNIALQQHLNGQASVKITRFGSTFSPGDKVIQIINNYDKAVFNGDIGFITQIDMENSIVFIEFDQDLKEYDFQELDEIRLAYAISIHKSQGSEFPIIVMPLATQHYTLLARNLLYTGITRGKKLVVLVGQKKAVAMAVHNNKESKRLTKLSLRLRE